MVGDADHRTCAVEGCEERPDSASGYREAVILSRPVLEAEPPMIQLWLCKRHAEMFDLGELTPRLGELEPPPTSEGA